MFHGWYSDISCMNNVLFGAESSVFLFDIQKQRLKFTGLGMGGCKGKCYA
jgi:hypothetical protein